MREGKKEKGRSKVKGQMSELRDQLSEVRERKGDGGR
jgi:hypothetical protein